MKELTTENSKIREVFPLSARLLQLELLKEGSENAKGTQWLFPRFYL